MNVVDLLAVLAFGLTCFEIGYTIGKDRNDTNIRK